ncbi:hypothetical protein MNEG_6964 [Monoraphidium neglectum]|uniref:Uncharacterized protein n=1 Tax=Monoraphidium neglectum TaxID=145388 RepID=A0A0D2L0S8_9CHLO|nr:hypothetical protein MNEG_6964 [Monoraphidium neglectum]KIZ00999.1 hypothetical protein MNEG_6964 [Monoraphidium neglectum]|eukprot:XP_013900018.1 hypothetical protein MNEG_6964 [Monoraphidium neglectum]
MVAPGKWAVVTGANRGLGFDVAKQLAASGRSVIITSRDKAAGAAAAQALSEAAAPGARVVVLQLEASSPDSIRALAAEVQAEYEGQVDLLVGGWDRWDRINNAGMTVDGISAADHEATLKTNLDGAIDITLALLLHLAQGARVVQVASRRGMLSTVGPGYGERIKAAATLDEVRAAAHRFDPDHLAQGPATGQSYAVSKAALIRATQLMAESPHFKARDISVVAVAPGWWCQGARSILLASEDNIPNGSFSYDGKLLDWTSK